MRKTVALWALALALVPPATAQVASALALRQAMDHFKRGEERLKDEKFEEAAVEFEKAVKLHPTLVLAHYGLGQARMAVKQYPAAVSAFSAARDAYYKMASLKLEDRMSSLEASQRALDGYRNLTGIEGGGRTGKGINERLNVLRDLETAKRLDDGSPEPPAEISLALAGAWFRSGNVAEAEKENQNALKANPQFGQAHNNLAVIYMMDGRLAEAQAEAAAAERAGFAVNPKLKEEIERRAATSK